MKIGIPINCPKGTKRCLLVSVTAILIIIFYLSMTLSTAWQKSAHFDETPHIMSGYFMLKYGDYRVNTANMILSQKVAALPLIISNVNPPPTISIQEAFSGKYPSGGEAFGLGVLFLNKSGNNSQKLLLKGRMMMAFLGLLTAVAVFFWSKRLFGSAGGLISICFLATCPVFISFSGIIGADIAVSALFLLTTWMFWVLIHRVTPFTVGAFGVLAGLLLITKMSSLAFGPISLTLLLVRILVNRPLDFGWGWTPTRRIESRERSALTLFAALAVAAIVTFITIWSSYGFRYSATPPEATGVRLNWQEDLDQQGGSEKSDRNIGGGLVPFIRVAKAHNLLPEAFLFDLAYLRKLMKSRTAFFLGETSTDGWLLYFPVAFLAKSGFPLVLALIVAAGSWFWLGVRRKGTALSVPWKVYDCLPILVFTGIFMFIVMTSSINIGHRHILPIYPFIYIFLGGLVFIFQQAKLWPKLLLGLLLATSFATAMANHPNHLTYISPLFGGPSNGCKIFADSSLEWGQELPAVRKWVDSQSVDVRARPIYFSYFGSGSPEAEGIYLPRLPGFFDPLQTTPESCTFPYHLYPGTYLISGTMLQPVYYSRHKGDDFGVDFSGPWCRKFEDEYQEMRRCAEEFYATKNPALLKNWMKKNCPKSMTESQAEENWMDVLPLYDMARFAKLTSYLRHRKPDANINYSVYIFSLDEKELKSALEE